MNDLDDDDASDQEALATASSDAYDFMRMANNILRMCLMLGFADVVLFYIDAPVWGVTVMIVLVAFANAWVEVADMVRVSHERMVVIQARIERRRDV